MVITCPVGLLFDEKIQKCNYENLVKCKELIDASTTTITTIDGRKKIF